MKNNKILNCFSEYGGNSHHVISQQNNLIVTLITGNIVYSINQVFGIRFLLLQQMSCMLSNCVYRVLNAVGSIGSIKNYRAEVQ